MKPRSKVALQELRALVERQADFIVDNQSSSGAIPWYQGGITDPWDHVEGAIALSLAGRLQEAALAFEWSRTMQNTDGSWYSSYQGDEPQDLTKDTNFATYIATGTWFHYLVARDLDFLRHMWPAVEKAIDFALRLQQPTGEILWALSPRGDPWPGAILTASCSAWHSIQNGLKIANKLGMVRSNWDESSQMLLNTLRAQPELFDRMGEDRRRYAMNWFYPVLTGVMQGEEARRRIEKGWADFVIDNWGCRVAADEDVTAVAETSELMIALCLIGFRERAVMLLDWTLQLRDNEDGFCRGIKLPEEEAFPKERATWTSAALIMAITALAKT